VYNNGVYVGQGLASGWRKYHWMADQINRVDPHTQRRPAGLCQHLKVDTEYDATELVFVDHPAGTLVRWVNWIDANYDGGGGLSPTGSATNPNDPGYSNLAGDFRSTATYANLCLEALNKQITQVPPEISLINFFVEFKDFKPLVKSLRQIPRALKNGDLVQQVSKPALNKRQLPKKVAKSGVDSFLSWNFQWAPLIGDLRTLTKIGDSTAKRLGFLVKTKNKPTVIRFSKPDCYSHPDLGAIVFSDNGYPIRKNYVLKTYTCDFTSSWVLLHNLNEINEAWASLKATFASLGINNPVKAAWNAIPFSFLLDWVGPFGKWLDRAAVQPFTGQWDISEVSSSVHEVYTIDFEVLDFIENTTYLAQTVKVDKYSRLDGLPFTLGAVDFSQLTDTQQKLALSIPLSKVLK
jgi:hypothetical protein